MLKTHNHDKTLTLFGFVGQEIRKVIDGQVANSAGIETLTVQDLTTKIAFETKYENVDVSDDII